MKFYLASRFRNRPLLSELKQRLVSLGHEVNSRWLDSPIMSKYDENYDAYASEWAIADLEDIEKSDAILLVTIGCEACPGGIWWEAGYAMALNKQVIIIGPKVNIFCNHPDIKHYDEIENYLECFVPYWVPQNVYTPGVYAHWFNQSYTTDLNDTLHFKSKYECMTWISQQSDSDWVPALKHGFIEPKTHKHKSCDIKNLHDNLDANAWAEEFVKLHGGDKGLMLSWFANAIMCGYDNAHRDDRQA